MTSDYVETAAFWSNVNAKETFFSVERDGEEEEEISSNMNKANKGEGRKE